MGDLAQLITAIAALVTSMGGAVAAVIIALRSGSRQAKMDPTQVSAMFDLMKKIPGANAADLKDESDHDAPDPPAPSPPTP